jgi:hypothetical protein
MAGRVSGDGSFGLPLGICVSLALTQVLFRLTWLMKVELTCILAVAAFFLGLFAGVSLTEVTIPDSFNRGGAGFYGPRDVFALGMGLFTGGLTAILVTRSLVKRLFLFQREVTETLEIAFFAWLAVSCLIIGGLLILALGSFVLDGVTVQKGLVIGILSGCLAALLALWRLAWRWFRREKSSGHVSE